MKIRKRNLVVLTMQACAAVIAFVWHCTKAVYFETQFEIQFEALRQKLKEYKERERLDRIRNPHKYLGRD